MGWNGTREELSDAWRRLLSTPHASPDARTPPRPRLGLRCFPACLTRGRSPPGPRARLCRPGVRGRAREGWPFPGQALRLEPRERPGTLAFSAREETSAARPLGCWAQRRGPRSAGDKSGRRQKGKKGPRTESRDSGTSGKNGAVRGEGTVMGPGTSVQLATTAKRSARQEALSGPPAGPARAQAEGHTAKCLCLL
jgi:hypothetical protein